MRAQPTFRDMPDADLAVAVHGEQSGAFECLIERYQDALFRFALRLLGNEFDAEEVVQDAVLRARRALISRYDAQRLGSLTLRPWLFRITRNLALNRRRAARRHPFLNGRDLTGVAGQCASAAGDGRPELLESALSGLDASDRELLELRFFQELSYREIAAIVGGTDSALRGRLYRALRRLRQKLHKLGYAK